MRCRSASSGPTQTATSRRAAATWWRRAGPLTATHLLMVLRGDPQPRFSNWSMDFDFAAAPPPPGFGSAASVQRRVPAATPEQENIFWQSIADSTDPADFESYLEQFPNGVFRPLAQNRLRAIGKTTQTDPAGATPARPEPESAHVPRPICDFDSSDTEVWFDCWYELASPADCYSWHPLDDFYGYPEWTGDCVDGLANGPGELVVMTRHPVEDREVEVRHTGLSATGRSMVPGSKPMAGTTSPKGALSTAASTAAGGPRGRRTETRLTG